VRATYVHAVAIKVHLSLFCDGLRRRDGRWEGGAGRRIVVGGVEGGRYRVGVVHVREGRRVSHHRRAHGREAKVLLEGASRAYYRVLIELESVEREGHLRLLRRVEVGRMHGGVERIVVQSGFSVRVVRYHYAVDSRYLRRGFCSSLGRLIDKALAWVRKIRVGKEHEGNILFARRYLSCEHAAGHNQTRLLE
jgi:hypothetical protein